MNGKTEYRIVVETKDWDDIDLPKINDEIDGAMKNRNAKYGIFVVKWKEALPDSVGCFNYYNDDRVVCGLGSKDDEILHEEILHVAYCWARANILRKSAMSEEMNFEIIDANLGEIKSQLDVFNTIKNQCTSIDKASGKIKELCDGIETQIQQNLRKIRAEMQKGTEKELEQ